jgi:hypothetical protein
MRQFAGALRLLLVVALVLPYSEPVLCALEDECPGTRGTQAQQAAFATADDGQSVVFAHTATCCYPPTAGPVVRHGSQPCVLSAMHVQVMPYKWISGNRW